MYKNIPIIFFLFFLLSYLAHGQGLQNLVKNIPEGTELTIRNKVNVPANNSIVELVKTESYEVDNFKSLILTTRMSSSERIIEKNTTFTIKRVEYIAKRDEKEGTYKVKLYYGDKREFFIFYFYPEQNPKIAALSPYFKINLPKASRYESN